MVDVAAAPPVVVVVVVHVVAGTDLFFAFFTILCWA